MLNIIILSYILVIVAAVVIYTYTEIKIISSIPAQQTSVNQFANQQIGQTLGIGLGLSSPLQPGLGVAQNLQSLQQQNIGLATQNLGLNQNLGLGQNLGQNLGLGGPNLIGGQNLGLAGQNLGLAGPNLGLMGPNLGQQLLANRALAQNVNAYALARRAVAQTQDLEMSGECTAYLLFLLFLSPTFLQYIGFVPWRRC